MRRPLIALVYESLMIAKDYEIPSFATHAVQRTWPGIDNFCKDPVVERMTINKHMKLELQVRNNGALYLKEHVHCIQIGNRSSDIHLAQDIKLYTTDRVTKFLRLSLGNIQPC